MQRLAYFVANCMQLAEECYQTAIVAAARLGRTLASALASERYGAFLLNKRNAPEEAKHKFDFAIRRYNEWGAAKKVQILREKHRTCGGSQQKLLLASRKMTSGFQPYHVLAC
jgi:hypothetical protein